RRALRRDVAVGRRAALHRRRRRARACRRARAVPAPRGRAGGGRLRPGELVLDRATRTFSVRADRGRTLKELVLRRRAAGPPPVTALDDISLHVEPGETLGIVGRNGAGKTSTLRVLAGIVTVQEGRFECGGQVVALAG